MTRIPLIGQKFGRRAAQSTSLVGTETDLPKDEPILLLPVGEQPISLSQGLRQAEAN
jgi:hypothetical protein